MFQPTSSIKKHILIVDDSMDIHFLLSQFFKDEGYEITIAENGKLAIDFLANCKQLPDLILLDLMMPVMDGFQFRIEQQKDSRLARIPVIIMTAGTDIKESVSKTKAHGFLKKPFANLEYLLNSVSAAFS